MLPEVSVIIPTYNRKNDLANALVSLFNQTFRNWEVLIVDDCSNDGTDIFVNKCKLRDDRIRYFKTKKNSGSPVEPRNLGVEKATAKYIAFLDSDDLWLNTKLNIQLNRMGEDGSKISYHDLRVVKNNKIYNYWSRLSSCYSGMVFDKLLFKDFIPTSSVMMTKELYESVDGQDPFYTISHDWDMWLKISEKTPISYIDDVLGILNLHSGSVITSNHKRRVQCRHIIRKWKSKCDKRLYKKILLCYYLVEISDLMPDFIQSFIKKGLKIR